MQTTSEACVDPDGSTALPEVVGKLFMLDDSFFRSPFLRQKLPPLLFSNGTQGFDRFFADFAAPRSARNSFFHTEEDDSEDTEGPPTPTFSSSVDGMRLPPNLDNGCGSGGVIRNIPIRVEGNNASSAAFPPTSFASVTATLPSSVSYHSGPAATDFHAATLPRHSSTSGATYQHEKPDRSSFHATQFPSEERDSRKSFSSGRLSPPTQVSAAPEPPQRRSFARLLQPQQQRPVSGTFDDFGRSNNASPSLSMPTFRSERSAHRNAVSSERERPTTPVSQRSRPKSPGLQSLRNGLRKATTCVRRPPNSTETSDVESVDSRTNNLYSTINKPDRRQEELDAVEEAIRSLEAFDPNQIIADAAASRNNRVSTASDSDTGSVVIRSSRIPEASLSSGIVSDVPDLTPYRVSGSTSISENEAASSSDNDAGSYVLADPTNLRRHHPSVEPSTAQSTATATPQPPAVSRIAHAGSFGATPQRAVVSQPVPTAPPPTSTTTTVPVLHVETPSVNDSLSEGEDETAAMMRKRILCAQMTDCAKVIEINGIKMNQFTGMPGWRHPQLLLRNLNGIQDTVYVIEAALDELLEFTQRIAIARNDPKHDELIQMVTPLRTSQALIHRLRSSLDASNWDLRMLARTAPGAHANDALDQFAAILHQLPKDCRKLVQWVYLLGTPSTSGGARFLPRHSPGAVPFPVSTPIPEGLRDDSIRTSATTVPVRVSPSNSAHPPPTRSKPSELLAPPTLEEIAMDGGESTTSSNGSSGTEVPGETDNRVVRGEEGPPEDKEAHIVEEDDLASVLDGHGTGTQVYEEDDLMSVVSDTGSLTHDYSLLTGDTGSLPRASRDRSHRNSSASASGHLSTLLHEMNEEERELVRHHTPQLEQRTATLCGIIDEFFAVLERSSQEAPKVFQKIRLITLETRMLVCIGENLAQCIGSSGLRTEFHRLADRLNSQLAQCINTARSAKEQYPSVQAVKSLTNAVVALADAAHSLRQLGRACV